MVTAVSKIQYSLDLEPALTEQFRTLKQVLAAAVYGFRGGLGAVAVHCDLSPSALSRMLNENEGDPRHLPVDLLPLIVEVTQDMRPVHWLVAKFLPSEEARTRAAVAQLENLAPQIVAALAVIQKSSKVNRG
jgi:hypothetical protein